MAERNFLPDLVSIPRWQYAQDRDEQRYTVVVEEQAPWCDGIGLPETEQLGVIRAVFCVKDATVPS